MMRKITVIAILLLTSVIALTLGCSEPLPEMSDEAEPPEESENPRWFSDSMRWLTDAEKDKAIDIALNTPEALRQLESESVYESEVDWIAMASSGLSAWWVLEYETVETGVPAYVPQSADIYPCVFSHFGNPEDWIIMVAVDLEAEEAVLVDEYPSRADMDFPSEGE